MVGCVLGNQSSDLCYHPYYPLCSQFDVLEGVDNHLLVFEYNQTFTFYVVSALFKKTRGRGEGHLFEGRNLFYNLTDSRGIYSKEALFRRIREFAVLLLHCSYFQ